MQRARKTAEIAGFPHAQVTSLLNEFDYGEYEGITSQQIHAENPGWDLYRDGCPGGESPSQVNERASQFLELASQQGGNVLVFAHGHILRAVGVAWLRLDITVATLLRLDVATLSVLVEDDHGRGLAIWNSP
jgi:probable phosphoglycerate mutase